jgi:hypothetical protein
MDGGVTGPPLGVLPGCGGALSAAPPLINAPGSLAATRANRCRRWASVRRASIAAAKVTWLGSSPGASMRTRPGSANDCRMYPRGSPTMRPSSSGRAPSPKRLSAATASRADIFTALGLCSRNGKRLRFRRCTRRPAMVDDVLSGGRDGTRTVGRPHSWRQTDVRSCYSPMAAWLGSYAASKSRSNDQERVTFCSQMQRVPPPSTLIISPVI